MYIVCVMSLLCTRSLSSKPSIVSPRGGYSLRIVDSFFSKIFSDYGNDYILLDYGPISFLE